MTNQARRLGLHKANRYYEYPLVCLTPIEPVAFSLALWGFLSAYAMTHTGSQRRPKSGFQLCGSLVATNVGYGIFDRRGTDCCEAVRTIFFDEL